MSKPQGYFRYWGKAEKEGGGYHLLVYHCLDVGAVAVVWWENSSSIRRDFLESGKKDGGN